MRTLLAIIALFTASVFVTGCAQEEPEPVIPIGDPNGPGPKPSGFMGAGGGAPPPAPKEEKAPAADEKKATAAKPDAKKAAGEGK